MNGKWIYGIICNFIYFKFMYMQYILNFLILAIIILHIFVLVQPLLPSSPPPPSLPPSQLFHECILHNLQYNEFYHHSCYTYVIYLYFKIHIKTYTISGIYTRRKNYFLATYFKKIEKMESRVFLILPSLSAITNEIKIDDFFFQSVLNFKMQRHNTKWHRLTG